MSAEQQLSIELRGIQLDLPNRSLLFLAAQQPDPVAAVRLEADGRIRLELMAQRTGSEPQVLHQCPVHSPGLYGESAVEACSASTAAEAVADGADQGAGEKQSAVVLSGRLLTKPKEGRADSAGRPTAWARFGVQADGTDLLHQYLATFHRGSRAVALSLPNRANIIAEGYVHPASAANRLDTFSVFAIRNRQAPAAPAPTTD